MPAFHTAFVESVLQDRVAIEVASHPHQETLVVETNEVRIREMEAAPGRVVNVVWLRNGLRRTRELSWGVSSNCPM